MKNAEKSLVYVGTYSHSEKESLFLYEMNNITGELQFIKGFNGGKNPSYFTFDAGFNYLYAVNEIENYAGKNSGAGCAFAVDAHTGFITLLNRVASMGTAPASISISADDKVVMIANYKNGSVVTFPVLQDGSLGEATDVKQHKGSSINKERQESAHAHYISFSPDDRFVFVVDLGMDKILRYHLDTKSERSRLTGQATAFHSPPGTGPRQMCFHPNGQYAYLIHELKSIVAALSYDKEKGIFTELQIIATIPENFTGENKCGGIRISTDGKHLYGSNRGHDSIAVFSISPEDGRLSFVENVPSGGNFPREFTIDLTGNFLLAANQHSNNIVTFKIDENSGRLTPTRHQIEVEKPVFVRVTPAFN